MTPPRTRAMRLLAVGVIGALLGIVVYHLATAVTTPRRTTPVFDPPVLAGQQLWGACAGGFHARRGETVVVTSSGHCAREGTIAYEADGRTVRGTFGPVALDPECPYPTHYCRPSDMNYLVIAEDRIPWGRLNLVDLGVGGYHEIAAGTVALACDDIDIGDPVAINGRDIHRTGSVTEKGEYLHDDDGDYFPCMVVAEDILVGVGDSGGAVLVRGLPAGAASRSLGGSLGFTPLAEGLEALDLDLCTEPDCGLVPPASR